jgi:hypothetical protein
MRAVRRSWKSTGQPSFQYVVEQSHGISWGTHAAPVLTRARLAALRRSRGVEVSESAAAQSSAPPYDEPAIPGPEERRREELQMLLVGFGTGLTIAGVFLIYIILDIAKLL